MKLILPWFPVSATIFSKKKQKKPVSRTPTLARASTRAPFLRRQRTTSTCPARAAMCSAVSPRCRKVKKIQCFKPPWRNIALHFCQLRQGAKNSACMHEPSLGSLWFANSAILEKNYLYSILPFTPAWSHMFLRFLYTGASASADVHWTLSLCAIVQWTCLFLGIVRHTSLKMEASFSPDGLFLHTVWSWQL